MSRAIKLNDADNVAVAVDEIGSGEQVNVSLKGQSELEPVEATEEIPFGHKVALEDVPEGERIKKYGEVIGNTTKGICIGDHVHVQNVESNRGRGDRAKE